MSGAFDRVKSSKLLKKLQKKGVTGDILNVVQSWLGEREARVVVNGTFSKTAALNNMVFQGTVWGPPLWNCFFEDARVPVINSGFTETVFADDLNCFRSFGKDVPNPEIMKSLQTCQSNLHSWGRANQVQFDPKKESFHILHREHPCGLDFNTLGVVFDTKLIMDTECDTVASAANWKLRTVMKTRRFHTEIEMFQLFKSHVLPSLEYRTPAIYHASATVLDKVDSVQRVFLRDMSISAEDALMNKSFNLAPLGMRRDIAMLGAIHRAVLKKGPKQLRKCFFFIF